MKIVATFLDLDVPSCTAPVTFVSAPPRGGQPRPPRRPDVPLRELLALHDAGVSLDEIADIVGVSAKNCRRRLRANGRTISRAPRVPLGSRARFEARRGRIWQLLGQRMNYVQIAGGLGLRPRSLWSWMRRWMRDALAHALVVPDRRAPSWRETCRKASRTRWARREARAPT